MRKEETMREDSRFDDSDNPGTEIHIPKETKVMLDREAYRFRNDVAGKFGKVEGKGFVTKAMAEFRYAQTAKFKEMLKNEAIMVVKLLQNNSTRAIRILKYGEVNNLKYLLTSPVGKSLDVILKNHPHLEPYAYIQIVFQTFMCIRDVHMAKSGHFDVEPGSFSLKRGEPKIIIFSSFARAVPLKSLLDREKEERVRRGKINKYSSRRTHKGQRLGEADDFESWIYMIVEIVNEEPLKWANLKLPAMLYNKWCFIQKYNNKNTEIEKRMKCLINLAWSCNQNNSDLIDDLMYREVLDWYDHENVKSKNYPWEVGAK